MFIVAALGWSVGPMESEKVYPINVYSEVIQMSIEKGFFCQLLLIGLQISLLLLRKVKGMK